MLKFFLYSAASAVLLAAPLTRAEPIGPCPTCDGAQYTLSYIGEALPDVNPQTETFRIFLDVDTTNYTGGGTFLDNVGIKVSSISDLIDATLTNAPGGIFNWSGALLNVEVDDTGCATLRPGTPFICADGFENGAALPGPFTFSFDVTVLNGTLLTDPLAANIQARYVNASGARTGNLLNEQITLQVIPEPETYAMLLLGLAFLGAQMARRRS